ncbi:MAG: hypothetical protein AAB954_01430 [Patescibacteria group bacterium]
MKSLKEAQVKGLSEFLNTVAAAWFSAGAILPLFITENFNKVLFFASTEIIMSLFFLTGSLLLLGKIKHA